MAADDDSPSLSALLGAAAGELEDRLGEPGVDRRVGGQRWLVFELDGIGSLRCRCSPRLSSWSLAFDEPLPPSLRDAAAAVGLWPELGPDAVADGEGGRTLVRRRVRDRRGDGASATALLGPEGVIRLAIFDEEPEW